MFKQSRSRKVVFLIIAAVLFSCSLLDRPLSGIYVSQEEFSFYRTLDFRGESSVVISGFFGTSYERDGNTIRIKTDKMDLLLTVRDGNTLVGEGWAKGTYVRR